MRRRPALCVASGLAAGIGAAHLLFFLPALWPLPVALAAGLALWIAKYVLGKRVAALVLAAAAFVAGTALYRVHAFEAPPAPVGVQSVSGIIGEVRRTKQGVSYLLEEAQGGGQPLPGRLMLYAGEQQEMGLPGQQLTARCGPVSIPSGPRNPGGFNAKLYGFVRGYHYIAYAQDEVSFQGQAYPLANALHGARGAALAAVDALWPGAEENPILRALLLGDETDFPQQERQVYSRLGIVHILSVSGLHVGFVALLLEGLFALLFRLVPRRFSWLWGRLRWARAALCAAGLVAYGALTGDNPATMRAVIMLLALLVARACTARLDGLSAVGIAGTVALLLRPMDLFSISFQLSFAAVIGMILLGGWLRELLARARMPGPIASPLSATFSAQIGTLPLVARVYGEIPLLGLLSNLFAVPLSGAIVMLGLPVLALYFIWPQGASAAAYPLALCARLLSRLAAQASRVPGVSAAIASPSTALMIAFWALALLLSPAGRRAMRGLRPFALAGGAVALAFWLVSIYPPAPTMTMLDVGQGHASILRHGGVSLLFDGGDSRAALDATRHYNLRYDAAFVSHGDLDHIGVVGELIQQDRVERLYLPAGIDEGKPGVAAALAAARRKGIPVASVGAGEVFLFGELAVAIHAPLPYGARQGPNANMMVASVLWREEALALFTGDLDGRHEQGIAFPAARVLQVAHHGSNEATSRALIDLLSPQVAAIPVGANAYGHPGERLLHRLDEAGVQVERTDESGALEFYFGDRLTVKRWARER